MHGTTKVFIDRLADAVDDLCEWPIPEEDAVDVVGEIKRLVRKLNDPYKSGPGLVQQLQSEMPASLEGELYVNKATGRKAERTYNTHGLLGVFAEAMGKEAGEWDIPKTISALMGANAIEFKWRWTELQAVANLFDVTLSIAKHEIEDGDPEALVGEVWSTTTKIEPKETA